jgi:homogentisate 1,2-dioxygenase
MSEFMRRVFGVYDSKPEAFLPGGMSLHCMLHHGLDSEAHERASSIPLKPSKLSILAFMLETRFPQSITAYAAELLARDHDYPLCWDSLEEHFSPPYTANRCPA